MTTAQDGGKVVSLTHQIWRYRTQILCTVNLLSEPPSYENCIVWFMFVISRVWVSIQNTAGDTRFELFPDTQVLISPLIHVGRHGSIKHSMLRSMASLHWVVLLKVDNAWSTFVVKWKEIVTLKREKFMGLHVFITFFYDGFWSAFENRLKYFDEYQPEIKFKTSLYLCAVQRPIQRWVS